MTKTETVPALAAELSGLSRGTLIAVFTALGGIVEASKYDDTEVKQSIVDNKTLLLKVNDQSNKLESYEKNQIEEILAIALNDASLADVLSGFAINVQGVDYSIKSVIEAYVNSPQIIENNFQYNSDSEMIAITITLTTGAVAVLTRVVQIDEATGDKTHIFAGEVSGIPVSKTTKWKNAPILLGATAIPHWLPVSESNVVFDMTSQLSVPVIPNIDQIVDINKDGKTGN